MEETNTVLLTLYYCFIPLINPIPSSYLPEAMYFSAGNQALYGQTLAEHSWEPSYSCLSRLKSNSIDFFSWTSKTRKVQVFTNHKRWKHWKIFTKTLITRIILHKKCIRTTTQRIRQAQGPLYFPTHFPVSYLCVIFPERKGFASWCTSDNKALYYIIWFKSQMIAVCYFQHLS